jgi:hypothetical protein
MEEKLIDRKLTIVNVSTEVPVVEGNMSGVR